MQGQQNIKKRSDRLNRIDTLLAVRVKYFEMRFIFLMNQKYNC